MTTEEKFNEVYQKIVNEYGIEMEQEREEVKNEKEKNLFKTITVILICYFVIKIPQLFITNEYAFLYIYIIVAIVFVIVLNKHKIEKTKGEKYEQDFKEKVIKSLIDSFQEGLEYKPYEGIDSETFSEAKFEGYDIYHSEDFVRWSSEKWMSVFYVRSINRRQI